MKKFKLKYNNKEIEVYPHIDKYCLGDSLAIVLIMADTHEPFVNLTVNLPTQLKNWKLGFEYQYVDVNNFPGAIEFILDNKLGELTRYSGMSGYCIYPVVKFDLGAFI